MHDFLDQHNEVDDDDDEDAYTVEMMNAISAVGMAVQILHEHSMDDAEASSVFTVDGVEVEVTVSVRVV